MSTEIKPDKSLDVRGEVCPFPWVQAKKALRKLRVGQVLRIVGDHGPALRNIPQNFKDEDQAVLEAHPTSGLEWVRRS